MIVLPWIDCSEHLPFGILAALQRCVFCVLACVECPVTAPRLGESCVTCGVRVRLSGGSLQVETSKAGAKIVDRRCGKRPFQPLQVDGRRASVQ